MIHVVTAAIPPIKMATATRVPSQEMPKLFENKVNDWIMPVKLSKLFSGTTKAMANEARVKLNKITKTEMIKAIG